MHIDRSRASEGERPVSFSLGSEMCELLVAFEQTGSLAKLAALSGRDVSVVSRQLQRIAKIAPVLEKRQGRWRLSPLGQQVSRWTQDVASTQRRILQQQTVVRIGSTREFSARILAPHLQELVGDLDNLALSIICSEYGVEKLVTEGRADFGFDCGTPQDPDVRFKTVKEEPFAVVASPQLLDRRRSRRSDLMSLPHLQYQRDSASRLLQLSNQVPNVFATFNDIASIREACVAGLGWAVLPFYAVQRELRAGSLRRVNGWKIRPERFGVWWLRERNDIEPWVDRAIRWLHRHSLG